MSAEPETFSGDMFSGGGSAFDLKTFLWTARKFWWVAAIGLVGGAAAGLWLAKMEKPVYVSTAEIKVERQAGATAITLTGFPRPFESATTPEDLRTIEKSFASPALLRRVAEKIKAGGFESVKFHGREVKNLSADEVVSWLAKDTTVALIPDTRLIQISFRNGNPADAQRVNQLIVQEGIQHDIDQRIAASSENIRYLKEEVKKFEENLRASEEKLNAYTRTLGNVSIDNDLNIVANQLRELTSRATVAKAERIRLENEYAQVRMRLGDPARLLEIESIQRMPAISNLSVQIAEVKAKIAKLELRYREANPFMKQARSELAELEEALRKAVLDAPKTIESALANARRAEESIIREQKLQEEKVIQVRDLAVPSRVLQRQIDADRQALEAALKRLTEELSQARSQPVLLQVVNWAGYGVPEPSSKLKTLAMASFLGLMAGAGVIFLITQLDTTFKAGESAARILGLPLLGEIPACPAGPEAGNLPLACPALDDIHSPAAEAFRSLRAALRGPDEQPGPVLVCSAEPEAGSSFCAANLAVVFAQAGQRTLLVEANLREPVLASALLDRPAHAGLTEFLLREAGFANVINPTRQSLLDLVTAGAPSALPSEILSRERFGALLREAAPLYDRIVVDSAAVTNYSDTLGFARLLPVVCFVAAAGKTERDPARRAVEQLRQAGARPTGLIFNHNSSRRKKTRAEEAGPAAPAGRARPRPVPGPLDGSAPPGLQREPLPPGQARGGAPSAARASLPPGLATAPGVEKRDVSPAGRQRRLVFGELLSALQSAGMSPEEARQYLLLNLKIWSNEAPDDTDASQAAIERARLLSDLIERLIQSGIPRAEARARITQALDAWRAHPG